jgi:ketosteroid isomerase-like protein
MKKIIIVAAFFFPLNYLYAQNPEAEIKNLEQMEVQAILNKDSATLLKLWDKDYTVNSPDNVIYFAGKTTLDRPVLKRSRTTFTRDIEHISISGNFGFSMGSETLIPAGDSPQTGQVVKRRFTNIWQKQESGWKLVGRHANVICREN